MTTKQAVIDIIQRLPDNATIADIMAELYFGEKSMPGCVNSTKAKASTTTRQSSGLVNR